MLARLASWSSVVVQTVVVCLGVALTLNALTYLNFDFNYKFLQFKQDAIATGWYLPFYYSHVLVSAVILIVGFFQVSTIGRRWIQPHRYLGYLYVMGILFFAAPGGLVMSFFIDRGNIVLASFIAQTILWFVFTAIAFRKIRAGNIEEHKQWMWRSFALTFAAITLRIYIYIGSSFADLSLPTSYAVISWLSWLPNLIAIELFIRYRRG